jgi:hypothetical protein
MSLTNDVKEGRELYQLRLSILEINGNYKKEHTRGVLRLHHDY